MGKGIYSRVIGVLKYFFEIFLIVAIIATFSIGTYVIIDTNQVVESALPAEYKVYKPEKDDTKSFEELVEINSDVIGWITIYGTNIDYPVVQGENNNKYLKTDPEGKYSLSGSIFLDYRSNRNFTDFNTVIYGHSMAYNAMFGDISDYLDKEFFDSHKYGNLFFNGRDHGIEVMAFLEVDAYKSGLYLLGNASEIERQAYIKEVYQNAMHSSSDRIKTTDNVLLLSTCTSDVTNGRHLLIVKLVEGTFEDTFAKGEEQREAKNVDSVGSGTQSLLYILIILAVIILLSMIAIAFRRAEKKRINRKADRRKEL